MWTTCARAPKGRAEEELALKKKHASAKKKRADILRAEDEKYARK